MTAEKSRSCFESLQGRESERMSLPEITARVEVVAERDYLSIREITYMERKGMNMK